MKALKQYTAELIGTFALVFCGTGAIVINEVTGGTVSHLGVAATFGAIVTAVIYSIGEKSGAHINPAVTIAFYLSGRLKLKKVLPYVIFQIAGAILASSLVWYLFPQNEMLGTTLPAFEVRQTFILEIVLTFILMFVIIQVSTGSKEQGTLAGIAIGLVVFLEAAFAGPITGASMNPARSIGPAIISGHIEHLWVYIIAPVTGAALSIVIWKFLKANK